jgi:hypothetical protein
LTKESNKKGPHLDKHKKQPSYQFEQVVLAMFCVIGGGVIFFISKLLDYLTSHFDY